MKLGDTVKLSDGFLALQPPASQAKKDERGTVRGVDYRQEWDTLTLPHVRITLTLSHVRVATEADPAGSWWPAAMWEVTE